MYRSSSSANAEKQKLAEGLVLSLNEEEIPKHVAVIMDGNRRWARERGFPVSYGHGAGRMAMKALLPLCVKFGIKALTVFAFSTENLSRPKIEVDLLMDILEDVLRSDVEDLIELNVRASIIGERSMLSDSLQELMAAAEDRTRANSGIDFNLAINYGGKQGIIQACKGVASKVKHGVILGKEINEDMFEQELVTKFGAYPCPDLLIRTSGEMRLSNFLLWQLAYTELYFANVLFPDFGEDDLLEALIAYQKRRWRYDGI